MNAINLLDKIKTRTARIGIIGLGYVGLPLAIEFVKAGFPVTGFDIDPEKIKLLKKGKSYIKHIQLSAISPPLSAPCSLPSVPCSTPSAPSHHIDQTDETNQIDQIDQINPTNSTNNIQMRENYA
jgi:6-phosphogluconate dehydrogenase (decarboxylating)